MKKILLLASLVVAFVSCTKNFEDLNKSTYGIGEDIVSRIPVGGSQIQDATIWIMSDQENSWQLGMEFPGAFSGYCAANNYIDRMSSYTPQSSDNSYPYVDTYKHLYPNYNIVKKRTNSDISNPAFA